MSYFFLLLLPLDFLWSDLLNDEFEIKLKEDIIENFKGCVAINKLFEFWDNLVRGDMVFRYSLVGCVY